MSCVPYSGRLGTRRQPFIPSQPSPIRGGLVTARVLLRPIIPVGEGVGEQGQCGISSYSCEGLGGGRRWQARPLAAWCFLGAGAVHLLMAPEHFLGAGVVHLLVAPEHFREWWGYGWFFLALATFQTLYGLGLAVPAGPRSRREAYLLVGITANLLVLGLYAVTRTRGIPFFGPHAGELEPLSGPDILAAALETGALALLTWDLRRVASPGRTMATLLQCVGPAAAAILALAACVSPAEPGGMVVQRAAPQGIMPRACPCRPVLGGRP